MESSTTLFFWKQILYREPKHTGLYIQLAGIKPEQAAAIWETDLINWNEVLNQDAHPNPHFSKIAPLNKFPHSDYDFYEYTSSAEIGLLCFNIVLVALQSYKSK